MGKIFVITGPTCAGKDTICSALFQSKDFVKENNLEQVVRYTNRAQRENEENGKDYNFRSDKEMELLILSDFFIEYSSFQKYESSSKYVTTIYGTSFESIEDPEKNYVLTGSIEVFRDIKEALPEGCVFPIVVDAPDRARLERYLKRNNDDSGIEICRRIIDDDKKYNNEVYESLGITEENIFINTNVDITYSDPIRTLIRSE